jgi:hypothetical protein
VQAPKIGERIRFRPYAGREVEGIVRAIMKTTSGERYRMEYGAGHYIAAISLETGCPFAGTEG